MKNIDITQEGAKLALVLNDFGFKLTAQDAGYYRFKYGNREEEILPNEEVFVIDESILIELDLDNETLSIKSKIGNERNMESTGSKSYGFLPQPEQLKTLLINEYGLESTEDKKDGE